MDSWESRSLPPFVEAASKLQGRPVVDIILKTINHPNIFVFGEMLDLPQVQELGANAETKPYLNLLELFAYGTYGEFMTNRANYPSLTPPQIAKLQMLTLVDLANKQKTILYSALTRELGIDSVRQIEDMIIECTYKGLIRGKIDQRNQRLTIQFAIGRDVRPAQLPPMIATLQSWVHASEEFLKKIEEQLKSVDISRQQRGKHDQDLKTQLDEMKTRVRFQMEEEEMAAVAAATGGGGRAGMEGLEFEGDGDERRRGGRRHR
ncbi:putative COP9 signalosome complex subunit 7b [Paratrimastix pyriformis]|uniref:COP9 signalosome complex subunit 7b n=1 Tax=Paratrimastix pyriformis TaxID=342808 RepID=A0ABQ8ULT3_9EUKA|nr:putative COP9 signalosome complex subunit 7b [Paratrimastix pyriformis]